MSSPVRIATPHRLPSARLPAPDRASQRTASRVLCAAGLGFCATLMATMATTAVAGDTHAPGRSLYLAPHAEQAPRIDGSADDTAWSETPWQPIDQLWLGPEYSTADFEGRFKVVWDEDRLYLLAEITDDILIDSHRDPLTQYWDDDCLEIFIDEDHSGGDHQFNHNAFAYHMALDNQAIDIGTDHEARSYSQHVQSRWRADGNRLVWELAIDIYDENYSASVPGATPLTLEAGKTMGLMVAYCDNDGSDLRENFIGSERVETGAKDRGWMDAGIFGTLTLVHK
ncbi:MAG: hypothetical protein ACI87W_001576 [Halieaceae bacterium]|jgi:hypothetical protein